MPHESRRILAGTGLLFLLVPAVLVAQPVPVHSRDANGNVVVQATRIEKPIRVDGKLDDEAYGRVEALPQFIERTLYTMTPRMFLTALVQYSSSTTSLSGNVRFRWEYQPGSELFVVYTEGRDTLPVRGVPLETRGFVVKINRLLRF